VDADGIVVGAEKVPAGTVLWGAGVVASRAGRWLGAETDKFGKVMVKWICPYLIIPKYL
jgi:NADH dehydrogenase